MSVLECESLKLKEEVKQLTSLLEAARKSKSDTEGRLEDSCELLLARSANVCTHYYGC